jgi:hypothetical protein
MNTMDEQNKWDEILIYGWKIIMDEQNQMDEHNVFTTKSYVPM